MTFTVSERSLQFMLQLVKLQVTGKIIGGLSDIFPVQIQSDSVHSGGKGTETAGSFAADRIKKGERRIHMAERRKGKQPY